jgi:hypothetical protein
MRMEGLKSALVAGLEPGAYIARKGAQQPLRPFSVVVID